MKDFRSFFGKNGQYKYLISSISVGTEELEEKDQVIKNILENILLALCKENNKASCIKILPLLLSGMEKFNLPAAFNI